MLLLKRWAWAGHTLGLGQLQVSEVALLILAGLSHVPGAWLRQLSWLGSVHPSGN